MYMYNAGVLGGIAIIGIIIGTCIVIIWKRRWIRNNIKVAQILHTCTSTIHTCTRVHVYLVTYVYSLTADPLSIHSHVLPVSSQLRLQQGLLSQLRLQQGLLSQLRLQHRVSLVGSPRVEDERSVWCTDCGCSHASMEL